MKDDASWCEKTERTARATTDCIYAFWSGVRTPHGIKNVVTPAMRPRATTPHTVPEVKTLKGGGTMLGTRGNGNLERTISAPHPGKW